MTEGGYNSVKNMEFRAIMDRVKCVPNATTFAKRGEKSEIQEIAENLKRTESPEVTKKNTPTH